MVEEEDDEIFKKENPTVFKKYRVKKKIGEGAFGEVYLGQSIKDNEYVALKIELRKKAKPLLESEAFILYSLRGTGIPEVISFGHTKNYNVLVEPLLGKSLFDIFAENKKKLPKEDICLIGKQVIDRIQWVHSKYIVHRDIKPDNFLIGKKDPNVIYLIDFGLSKKYRSSQTNKHIRFGFTGKLTGTVRFSSANALRGGEQSRRDDIEALGYMLVYFMKGRLPWQGVTGNKKMERYLKIYRMKKHTSAKKLCEGLPGEMEAYIEYSKKLEFEQEPDYNYLRSLFRNILKKIHGKNVDNFIFSWINLNDFVNLRKPINHASRKDSPQSRLYKKIQSSLEKKRNMSSDSSDSKNGSYQQGHITLAPPTNNYGQINQVKKYHVDSEEGRIITTKKKVERSKDGLNTTIANLDVTVDDEGMDFDDEINRVNSKENYNNFMQQERGVNLGGNNNDRNNFDNNNFNKNMNNVNENVGNRVNNNNFNSNNNVNLNNINRNNNFNNNIKNNNFNNFNNSNKNSILVNNQNINLNNNNIVNNTTNNADNTKSKANAVNPISEGKEFTFNEPINFKNINASLSNKIEEKKIDECSNSEKLSSNQAEENSNNKTNEANNNEIYALLTGKPQPNYPQNNFPNNNINNNMNNNNINNINNNNMNINNINKNNMNYNINMSDKINWNNNLNNNQNNSYKKIPNYDTSNQNLKKLKNIEFNNSRPRGNQEINNLAQNNNKSSQNINKNKKIAMMKMNNMNANFPEDNNYYINNEKKNFIESDFSNNQPGNINKNQTFFGSDNINIKNSLNDNENSLRNKLVINQTSNYKNNGKYNINRVNVPQDNKEFNTNNNPMKNNINPELKLNNQNNQNNQLLNMAANARKKVNNRAPNQMLCNKNIKQNTRNNNFHQNNMRKNNISNNYNVNNQNNIMNNNINRTMVPSGQNINKKMNNTNNDYDNYNNPNNNTVPLIKRQNPDDDTFNSSIKTDGFKSQKNQLNNEYINNLGRKGNINQMEYNNQNSNRTNIKNNNYINNNQIYPQERINHPQYNTGKNLNPNININQNQNLNQMYISCQKNNNNYLNNQMYNTMYKQMNVQPMINKAQIPNDLTRQQLNNNLPANQNYNILNNNNFDPVRRSMMNAKYAANNPQFNNQINQNLNYYNQIKAVNTDINMVRNMHMRNMAKTPGNMMNVNYMNNYNLNGNFYKLNMGNNQM